MAYVYMSEKPNIKESYDESTVLIDDILVERADVQAIDLINPFTPSLCEKYPEMNKYKKVASECEEYFKNNEVKGTKGNVVLGKLNYIFNEILTGVSDITFVTSIFSANIPAILLSRIIKVISMNNEVDSGKEILEKNKQSLKICRDNCKNENEKKKIDNLIKKCDKAINDLENNTHEDHEKWAEKKKKERLNAREEKIANRKKQKELKHNKKKKINNIIINTQQKTKPVKESSIVDDCKVFDARKVDIDMEITQDRYDKVRLAIFEGYNTYDTINDYQKDILLEKLNETVDAYNNYEITESEAGELFNIILDKANGIDVFNESVYDSDIDDVTYVTESQYSNMRLKIFNDWDEGNITEDQKDDLLKAMNDRYEII